MHLLGWIEYNGKSLTHEEIVSLLCTNPANARLFGGEFYLSWNGYEARDHYGVIPGPCPAGTLMHHGTIIGSVQPEIPEQNLEEAIISAVRLRSDTGVTALSGGVDSTLVASLAKLPCISVGLLDSHDTRQAKQVAERLKLELDQVIISPREIEEVVLIVANLESVWTPVDIGIATTLFFIAQRASECGYERILTGQSADEIFGGYSRYLETEDLAGDLAKDFRGLSYQASRDQRIATYHHTYLSMPYLDTRVVSTAANIPPKEKVSEGIRKKPLRMVAARHIPAEYAYYEKRAMQYGTGIWKEIKRLARHNGYNTSVQDYINSLRRT